MENLRDNPDYGRLREAIKGEIAARMERLLTCDGEKFPQEKGFILGMKFVNDYLVRD